MHLSFEFFTAWFIASRLLRASSYRAWREITEIGFYGHRLVGSRLIINYFIRHHRNCLIGHSKHVNDRTIGDAARREWGEQRDEKVLTCPKMVSTLSRSWRRSCGNPQTAMSKNMWINFPKHEWSSADKPVRKTTVSGDCTSCSVRSMSGCIPPSPPASDHIGCWSDHRAAN